MSRRIAIASLFLSAAWASAQSMPADYEGVLKTLGKQGDFKANVLKVNIPRNDLKVTIDGAATPTPFGFGGWLAMTKGDGGDDVMMGDLVLLEDEVNPVMSALLNNGLEVTALHNHFFFESPRIFYMHVHGHGNAADLARMAKPAIDLIGHGSPQHQTTVSGGRSNITAGQIDTAKIAKLVGHEGEQSGPVYKITIGRDDVTLKEMGATINARMGLNTWAAFYGSDANAEVAGDVAMLGSEVTPVLKALRANGLDVVAIHNHMTGGQPPIYFLHYWGTGPAEKLATGFKAALAELGKHASHSTGQLAGARPAAKPQTVVFVCEHGSAKSVIAAAHFNRLATEKGLPYRAVARGTNPDEKIPPIISSGLAADGLIVSGWQPTRVSSEDVQRAVQTVTLAAELPKSIAVAPANLTKWNDVPAVSENYAVAREVIVRHVTELLGELAAAVPSASSNRPRN